MFGNNKASQQKDNADNARRAKELADSQRAAELRIRQQEHNLRQQDMQRHRAAARRPGR